jgi:hypothetical protein
MPEDKPKNEPSETPAQPTSPAPEKPEAAGAPSDKPAEAPTPPAADSKMTADPLPDGTVPTILSKGDTPHKDIKLGRGAMGNIYRRADVMTTLLTFGGAIVAAGIIFGVYYYLNRPKHTTAPKPTVTKLDSGELSKLGDFFSSDSTSGSSQVLTVNSSALFKNRVALSQDIKVLGAASVGGSTQLADLTVNGTTNLGVVSTRGALTVAGPLNLQSPATLAAGANVTGNLAVSGNGSFGGSISAGLMNITNLQVSGILSLSGHLTITGGATTASPADGAGSGASVNIDGNDSAGTITINTGNIPSGFGSGQTLVQVNFHTGYPKAPHVLITPVGNNAGALQYYVGKTGNFFFIGASNNATSHTSYTFDYWVIQ